MSFNLPNLLTRCNTILQIKSAQAAATTNGYISQNPAKTLTLILQTLTLIPPQSLSQILPHANSLFQSLPNPSSTLSHNLLIRLLLAATPSSPLPALRLFSRLRRLSLPPDLHSFPLAIAASSRLLALPLGRSLHAQTLIFGFASSLFVRNSLISLYSSCSSLSDAETLFKDGTFTVDIVSYNALIAGRAKAGDLDSARKLFDEMPQRDEVSYGTIIAALSRSGRHREALELFDRMRVGGVEPDDVALASALSSCARVGELGRGKDVHDYIRGNRGEVAVSVVTALVDMYAKCGEIDLARKVFDEMPQRNVFTWNAIIVGSAMHGRAEVSLGYFEKMRVAGVRPDGVTVLGVLVACSHSGLVEIARKVFADMERVYGVRAELKHYGCMADLFGRAGLIDEAMKMIEGMPEKGDRYVWGGMLAGCRIHRGNVEAAEVAARKLVEIDPGDTGVYSIMARIYADARRWEDVGRIRRILDAVNVKRNVGLSLVSCL